MSSIRLVIDISYKYVIKHQESDLFNCGYTFFNKKKLPTGRNVPQNSVTSRTLSALFLSVWSCFINVVVMTTTKNKIK